MKPALGSRMPNKSDGTNPADPATIKKFVDQLPIPEILTTNRDCGCETRKRPLYRVEMRETNHRFHRDFPVAKVWGYNGSCPGPTIEVENDTAIHVEWINNLPEKHLLPVDHSLHGTQDTPDVRTVVHLHGANVAADSDGHPEAWFTKNYLAVDQKFTKKIYEYTNHQPGGTLWYHDHTIGITRLNV